MFNKINAVVAIISNKANKANKTCKTWADKHVKYGQSVNSILLDRSHPVRVVVSLSCTLDLLKFYFSNQTNLVILWYVQYYGLFLLQLL